MPGLMPAVTALNGDTGAVMGTHAPGNLIGAPLIDPALEPFRVAMVTITREGVVEALRPAGMMFREAAMVPLAALPGRALRRDAMASGSAGSAVAGEPAAE